MNIRSKLTATLAAGMAASVALTALVIGAVVRHKVEDKQFEQAERQLVELRDSRRFAFEQALEQMRGNVEAVAIAPRMPQILRELSAGAEALGRRRFDPAASVALDAEFQRFGASYARIVGPEGAARVRALRDKLDPVAAQMLHDYAAASPYAMSERHRLDDSGRGSAYDRTHAGAHPLLRAFAEKFGFYDLILIDARTQRVVYSVRKEIDFGSVLGYGATEGSELAGIAWEVLDVPDEGARVSDNAAGYLPTLDEKSVFIAAAVREGDAVVGVIAAQVPLKRFGKALTAGDRWAELGLGRTGEIYMVGPDRRLRSPLRSIGETAPAGQREVHRTSIETRPVAEGLARRAGVARYLDRSGREVLGAWQPIDFGSAQWVLVAEVATAELLAAGNSLVNQLFLFAALVAAVMAAAAAAFAHRMTGRMLAPIGTLEHTVQAINAGDYASRARIEGDDEFARLGRAIDHLLDDRFAVLAEAERQNEIVNNSVIELLETVDRLSKRDLTAKAPVTEDIVGAISDSVNQLASETAEVLQDVTTVASAVDDVSRRMRAQAEQVSAMSAAERVGLGRMADTVSRATESMQRVALLAYNSNRVAERAGATTDGALDAVTSAVAGMTSIRQTIADVERRIKRLGERSHEVGQIVNLINTISERNHVLALNASMQAAIAGEAGRGFAVVAEEVQALASSSREATDRIGKLIYNIQVETNDAIAAVAKTIDRVGHEAEVAEKSGAKMRETRETTAKLVEMVGRITAAAEEHMTVAGELRARIDELGAGNAASVEQIEAQHEAVELMHHSARRLVELVHMFQLPGAEPSGAAAASSAPPAARAASAANAL